MDHVLSRMSICLHNTITFSDAINLGIRHSTLTDQQTNLMKSTSVPDELHCLREIRSTRMLGNMWIIHVH